MGNTAVAIGAQAETRLSTERDRPPMNSALVFAGLCLPIYGALAQWECSGLLPRQSRFDSSVPHMEETVASVARVREDVKEMLSFVDEIFPNEARARKLQTEFKMYPEEREYSAARG